MNFASKLPHSFPGPQMVGDLAGFSENLLPLAYQTNIPILPNFSNAISFASMPS
jgi:hypothetical protein